MYIIDRIMEKEIRYSYLQISEMGRFQPTIWNLHSYIQQWKIDLNIIVILNYAQFMDISLLYYIVYIYISK
jgi:hypothetical protein